jgi:hypothetical protein
MLLKKSLFNFRARLQPVSRLATKCLCTAREIIDMSHRKMVLIPVRYFTLVFALFLSASAIAQTTIQTTTYTGNGTGIGSPGTGISVSVQNTNPFAVIVTQFGYSCGAAVPHELWYSATSLTGSCGAVNSTNPAWTLAGTVPSPTTVTNTTIVDNFFSGLNVTIPANTTYRFCVISTTSSARYSAASAPSPTTWTAGGVTLDATNSMWGSSTSVGNTGRYYYGSVTFINACVGVTGLNVSNVTMSSASATWNAVTGSLGYEYAITTTPTPPSSGTLTSSTSANFSGLALNTQYYIHVRNKCTASFSNWSTTTFTTLNAYCLPPTNILFSDVTMTSADILWSKMPTTDWSQYSVDLTKYIDPSTSTNLKTTQGFTAKATSLQPYTWYYVHVRSFCLGGADSSTWRIDSFITKSDCEAPVISISNPGDNPTATWPAIPVAVAYEYAVTNNQKTPAFGTEIYSPSVNLSLPKDGNEKFLHVRTKCNSQFSFSSWSTVPLRVFSTSISSVNTQNGLLAYPNPANDRLSLEIGKYIPGGHITVYDVAGRILRNIPADNKKMEIDMTNLDGGIYTIRYTSSSGSEIIRVTKQ